MKRNGLILVSIAVILTLGVVPAAFADGLIEGRVGRAEVRFLEGMSDHHQTALDMANDCLKKAKSESVLKMCQDIIAAQTPEIKQLDDWLLRWYQTFYLATSRTHTMDQNGMAQPPDVSTPEPTTETYTDPYSMMGMMAGLDKLEGKPYEIAFLKSMIDHHHDAVHMSERILKSVPHKELRVVAQKVIDDQTAEIEKMERMITEVSKQ